MIHSKMSSINISTFKNILNTLSISAFIADPVTGIVCFKNSKTSEVLEICPEFISENLQEQLPIVRSWDFHDKKNKRIFRFKISPFMWDEITEVYLYEADEVTKLESERKKLLATQKSLKESELRWQFAVDGSELGLWDWNISTNEVFFSKQWKRMLGFEDHEISGSLEEWEKRVHPDDLDNVFKDINKHFDGKSKIYENEHRVLCKDGRYKWILDRGKIVSFTDKNKPLRMIGTHTDITSLKSSEEKFNKAFHSNTSGMSISDIESGQFVEVNKKFLKFLDLEREDVIGRTSIGLGIFENEVDRNLITKMIKEKGYIEDFEIKLKTHSDKEVYALISAEIINLNGRRYLLASAKDITDRKIAESILKESEAKYRMLIENSSSSIVIIQDNFFTFTNTAFRNLLGYSEKELNFDNNPGRVMLLVSQLLNGNMIISDGTRYESTVTLKNGKELVVEVYAQSVIFNKRNAGFLEIRDITRQKAMMEIIMNNQKNNDEQISHIPICASCNMIRDDDKEGNPWINPAEYISERFNDVEFSHTMCPDCIRKWYPGLKVNRKQ